MNRKKHILVGNSFPISLVRNSEVRMSCPALSELQNECKRHGVVSFWGHENTRAAAEAALGVSLKPARERPALTLSASSLPMLEEECFTSCWILSPDYAEGFRPAIGQEVGAEAIAGWSVVRMDWIAYPKGK